MPLTRFSVRNEQSLGLPELYRNADQEDPKAVLDGVAVAGLVGILRQLGDLAEFAAEVFHGLQEQVMTTASRSHKLKVRVQHIEASLPPLEKAVLAQTSHIHFAYTAASEWHPHIQLEQNHFVYNDLPRFIMDSYEECRDPPRLHMLDRFDPGGPGSCLKRYSDPTFFKRVSGSSPEAGSGKVQRDKKSRKSKKRRSSQRNREISRLPSFSSHSRSGRMNYTYPDVGDRSSSQATSTADITLKSDLGYRINSFDSRTGSGYIECVFNKEFNSQPGDQESKESTDRSTQHIDTRDSVYVEESTPVVDDVPQNSSEERIPQSSSCVTWDEKVEIVEPEDRQSDRGEAPEAASDHFCKDEQNRGVTDYRDVDQMAVILEPEDQKSDRGEAPEVASGHLYKDEQNRGVSNCRDADRMAFLLPEEDTPKSISAEIQPDEIESETENYMDALNTIESESENDFDCQTKREVEKDSWTIGNGKDEDPIPEIVARSSDQYPCTNDSYIASSDISSDEMPSTFPSSVTRKTKVEEQTPQIPEKSSHSDLHSSSNGMSFSLPNSVQPDNIIQEHIPEPPEKSLDIDPHCSSTGRSCSSLNLVPQNIHEQTSQIPEKSSVVEPHYPNNGMLSSLLNSSQSSVHEQTPQNLEKFSDSNDSLSINHHASADICGRTKVESSISDSLKQECSASDQSGSGTRNFELQDQSGDKIITSSSGSQQSHTEVTSVHPVTFWTNGGLLGLEPSKPPDFAVSKATSQNNVSITNFEASHPPNHTFKSDGLKEKLAKLVESSNSNANVDLADGSHNVKGVSSSNVTTALSASGAELVPIEAKSAEVTENDGNTSLVFGLGQRLLANGFRRKLSLASDVRYEPVSSVENGVSNWGSGQHHKHQTNSESTFIEQFGYRSPLNSLTSSPPIEHMKISFIPVDSSDNSKLKLKFPDGNHSHESVRDMFASFQLVPEHSVQSHDYGSESDDDTFCRSSFYMSDDCLSHHSDSNSEEWVSGESTGGSKDHELYDALSRMQSSLDSVSSFPQEGTMKKGLLVDHGFQSLYTDTGAEAEPDLPSFDMMDPLLQREAKAQNDLQNTPVENSRGPDPPPLPPVQWRVSKPHSDVADEREVNGSDDANHAVDQKLIQPSISKQTEVATARHQITNIELVRSKEENKEDRQQLRGLKETNLTSNGKAVDEKEDFLHQIRSKSFNLRPTAAARSNFTTGPPAKVTAILEKANAIRQVVGSDDDDSWSDT